MQSEYKPIEELANTEALIRHLKVNRFLMDINKLMDGVHIQETSEKGSTLVKFEAQLICRFASPFMWRPSAAFFDILGKLIKKHFNIDNYNELGFNNTNTVFWIDRNEIS